MHINRDILDSILPNLTFEDVFQFVDHSQHISPMSTRSDNN